MFIRYECYGDITYCLSFALHILSSIPFSGKTGRNNAGLSLYAYHGAVCVGNDTASVLD